jgi:hypothetical protein
MSSAPCDSEHDSRPVFVRAPDLLIREAEFGVVLASRTGGRPITLGGSAQLVWGVLDEPRHLEDLVDEVARRGGVESSEIHSDVVATVGRLRALDVVKCEP